MRIAGIERFPVTYQLSFPGVAPRPLDSVLIKVFTEEGVYGVGEAPGFVHYLGDTQPHILKCLDLIEEVIKGENPWRVARLRHKMRRVTGSGSRVPEAARAAVDMALYDIMGKDAGKPVYQLLNGGYRTSFAVCGTESGETLEEKVALINDYLSRGYKAIEVKLGIPEDLDLSAVRKKAELLKGILDAVPGDVEIYGDINQHWGGAKNVISMVNSLLRGFPNLYLEQPARYFDLEGLATIKNAVDCFVIADESAMSPEMVLQLARMQAVDMIDIKLPRVGGLYPAMQMVTIAESAGIEIRTDTAMNGKIGDTASAHLAACIEIPHPIDDGWTWLSPTPAVGGHNAEGRHHNIAGCARSWRRHR